MYFYIYIMDNNNTDFLVNDFNEFKNILVVCEDFYKYPFSVFKNSVDTGYKSEWPYGARTIPFINDNDNDIIHNISKHIPHAADPTIKFKSRGGSSGSFLMNTKNDYGIWNHTDQSNLNELIWAAVVYTHPFPVLACGTSLNSYTNTSYKHINSYSFDDQTFYARDNNRWFKNIYIGNVFNKLVIYTGNSFHSPIGSFGHTKFNCRGVNTFFFTSI